MSEPYQHHSIWHFTVHGESFIIYGASLGSVGIATAPLGKVLGCSSRNVGVLTVGVLAAAGAWQWLVPPTIIGSPMADAVRAYVNEHGTPDRFLGVDRTHETGTPDEPTPPISMFSSTPEGRELKYAMSHVIRAYKALEPVRQDPLDNVVLVLINAIVPLIDKLTRMEHS